MATNNLNIYDILVDIIPGSIAILLIVGLYRPINITPVGGVAILIIGYVVGRLIHAIGSINGINGIRRSIEECLFEEYLQKRKYGLSFRNRIRYQYGGENKFRKIDYQMDNVEPEITDNTIKKMESYFDVDTKLSFHNIQTHDEFDPSTNEAITDDVLSLRYLGENYLYGKDTLYRKYEILSTFYRSLWLTSLAGAIVYFFAYLLAITTGIGQLFHPSYYSIIYIILFITSIISLRQRIKYRFKKTRAFINDLQLQLPDKSDQ